MVRVRDISARANHVVASNLYSPACIQHHIAIEIISIADVNTNAGKVLIVRPKPGSFGDRVIFSKTNLSRSADPDAFESAAFPDTHAERPVKHYPKPAGDSVSDSKGEGLGPHDCLGNSLRAKLFDPWNFLCADTVKHLFAR